MMKRMVAMSRFIRSENLVFFGVEAHGEFCVVVVDVEVVDDGVGLVVVSEALSSGSVFFG